MVVVTVVVAVGLWSRVVKCILLRWCRYAPLDTNGVSQKGHLMLVASLPTPFVPPLPPAPPFAAAAEETAWLTAHENSMMEAGLAITLLVGGRGAAAALLLWVSHNFCRAIKGLLLPPPPTLG